MNIPTGYEAYKLNCTAGDAVVGVLCRRPDGGVSDYRMVMNNPAVDGVCPACGREMREVQSGTFTCSSGHLLVVMTNTQATRRKLGTAQNQPKARKAVMLPKRKSPALPALRTHQTRLVAPVVSDAEEDMTDFDLDAVIDAALKERMS